MQRAPGTPSPLRVQPILAIVIVVGAALLAAGAAAAFAGRATDMPPGPEVRVALEATETPSPTATATLAPPTPTASPSTPGTATATATASPTATPTPEPTPTPTPEPTPLPMVVDLRPAAVGNGETMLVWVHAPGAASASMIFRGQSFPLTQEGSVFWAVAAVPVTAQPAEEELVITARDSEGAVTEEHAATYAVVRVDRPVDYLNLTAEQGSILTPDAGAREYQLRLEQFSRFDRGRRWDGLFLRPAEGYLTTEYGQGRSINGGPVGGFHSGADIANAAGTPIIAAAAARVSWVGEMPIRGNTIILDHGSGVLTGYSHLLEILVEVDQLVEAGEVIGLMGSTGLSTGPHLHWELSIYGVNVDPLTWTVKDFTP